LQLAPWGRLQAKSSFKCNARLGNFSALGADENLIRRRSLCLLELSVAPALNLDLFLIQDDVGGSETCRGSNTSTEQESRLRNDNPGGELANNNTALPKYPPQITRNYMNNRLGFPKRDHTGWVFPHRPSGSLRKSKHAMLSATLQICGRGCSTH
jgi:hypothetical protein